MTNTPLKPIKNGDFIRVKEQYSLQPRIWMHNNELERDASSRFLVLDISELGILKILSPNAQVLYTSDYFWIRSEENDEGCEQG